jgi:hypothetical protein
MLAYTARRPATHFSASITSVSRLAAARHLHAATRRDVQASPAAPQPAPSTSLQRLLLPSFTPRDASAATAAATSKAATHRKMATASAAPLYAPTMDVGDIGGAENVERLRRTRRDFRSELVMRWHVCCLARFKSGSGLGLGTLTWPQT